jgi:hypothetical protein
VNENFEIYQAPDGVIPPEDKARLDGWLKGIEDQEALQRQTAQPGSTLEGEIQDRLRQLEEMGLR